VEANPVWTMNVEKEKETLTEGIVHHPPGRKYDGDLVPFVKGSIGKYTSKENERKPNQRKVEAARLSAKKSQTKTDENRAQLKGILVIREGVFGKKGGKCR